MWIPNVRAECQYVSVTAMQKLVVQLGTPSETPNVKKQLDSKRSDVQRSIETTGDMFREVTDQCKVGSQQEQVKPYLCVVVGMISACVCL